MALVGVARPMVTLVWSPDDNFQTEKKKGSDSDAIVMGTCLGPF